uniref:AB hydrolase-1 domain-containing protein n=1 Tax=Vannella robusta TaxID=1487602 RepID=A0A7S4IV17_9EUKA
MLRRRMLQGAGILVAITPVFLALGFQYRPHSSHSHFEATEKKLLNTHIKENSFTLKDVKISKNQFLHTLVINEGSQDKEKPNLVLMHGWSSGLALWSKNIDQLAKHYNVYAIDLLGFGRSGRPFFPISSKATPDQAKSFWVDSFHEWKVECFGNQKIILLGHSLGGFLACTYALEQPEDLQHVILAAPVGIAPFIIPPQKGWFRKSLERLIWDCGVTPQAILRSLGFFSQRVWDRLGNASNYRGLDKDGWDYLYQAQMGEPSGDRAFMSILTREGWGMIKNE